MMRWIVSTIIQYGEPDQLINIPDIEFDTEQRAREFANVLQSGNRRAISFCNGVGRVYISITMMGAGKE